MRTLDLLRELVEIESPTYSPGVRAVAERMTRELEALGGRVELLPGEHLRAEFDGDGAPLLLLGHTDTVWPVGTLASMPFRVDGARAYGPGVYDMKASLVLLVEAVRLAGERRRALRVFLTADEEKGSVTGKSFLEEAAADAAAAFVVEPPNAAGNLKTARKGIGRFRLHVTGRAAHAAEPSHGASAIDELARQILELKRLGDPSGGVTVNVGVIRGGTAENVVAAEAVAEFDVRVPSTADRDLIEAELAALRPTTRGTEVRLEGGWTRPPLERSPGAAALFAQAREHGRALGLGLHETSAAGGSDGNLVGAVGVPVLDGLGAQGGGAHARDEHVELASIPVRAELLAHLLVDPGL
ncbi:MAG TPA: M20 family metallopeptidase [Gaiellaceae bacterium]